MDMHKKTLVLFDADFILFTATMGNKCLDEDNNPIRVDGKFTYTDRTEEEVYNCADSIIKTILDLTNADLYIGYLGNCKSFRYNTYPEYKANRKDLIKPQFFNELKTYLVNKWNFILTENSLEADDAVNIVRNNFKNEFDCIIVSSDKDLIKSIEGTYVNARTFEIVNTTKLEAEKFFWKSMITGDAIDNIKGIPGKGEVFANKVIKLAEEKHTSLSMEVLDRYIRHFEEADGIDEFYKNYKCLHILDNFSNFVLPALNLWEKDTIFTELKELNI